MQHTYIAWTIWSDFNISFVTACTTPTTYGGLSPFSDDDYFTMCNLPWAYQSMIVGSFLAAYGHMINDWAYRSFKTAETSATSSLSNAGSTDKTPLGGAEKAAGSAASKG